VVGPCLSVNEVFILVCVFEERVYFYGVAMESHFLCFKILKHT
jgi:hypothetical protein